MTDFDETTAEEDRAISSLQGLAKRWPQSLMLVSMAGSLAVVHTLDPRFDADSSLERTQAVVADIRGIPNTGGDW